MNKDRSNVKVAYATFTFIFTLAVVLLQSTTGYAQVTIDTVAGVGGAGFSGDNGTAITAKLSAPNDAAIDAAGNIYVADELNNRIRKIAPSGIITTIAGSNRAGWRGDGGPATAAGLYQPTQVVVDAAGNLYILDEGDGCVRKVNTSGIITTIAGTGGVSARIPVVDGSQATSVVFYNPFCIAVDPTGNLYVYDYAAKLYKVNTAGIISTYINTNLGIIYGMTTDAVGNLYVGTLTNIDKIDVVTGAITKIAGDGTNNPGDGGLATDAVFHNVVAFTRDAAGDFYIVDGNVGIRKVDASTGIINNIAPYSQTGLNISSIAVAATGNLYLALNYNNRIVEIPATACSLVQAGPIVSSAGNAFCFSGSSMLSIPSATIGHNITYQWQSSANGTTWGNVGTDTIRYATGNITTTTYYKAIVACATSGTKDTSMVDTITITPTIAPAVSISDDQGTTTCAFSYVVFTAVSTSGGTSPTYQWQKNGVAVGTNSAIYPDNALNNNDKIVCIMTSSLGCASPLTATSNTLNMTVHPILIPSITLTSSQGDSVCPGTVDSFIVHTQNAGSPPGFQWQIYIGAISSTSNTPPLNVPGAYADNVVDGETVQVILFPDTACATGTNIYSNKITIHMRTPVFPIVGIDVNPGGIICVGDSVTFTAFPIRGAGSHPTYKWYRNATLLSATGAVYTGNNFSDNDAIICSMISSDVCAIPDTARNEIIMTVNQSYTPAIAIANNTGTYISQGQSVTFTTSVTEVGNHPKYQWQNKGANIPGAISSTYTTNTLADDDSITCVVYSDLRCADPDSAVSDPVVMHIATGINTIAGNIQALHLYPNPNRGAFNVHGTIDNGEEAQLDVLNMVGQGVYNTTVQVQNGQFNASVKLPDEYTNGFYLLRVKTNDGIGLLRFVTER